MPGGGRRSEFKLPMNETKYTPVIETKAPLTQPLSCDPVVNDICEFDFPFALEEMPRMLAPDESTTALSDLASKTITEGRSYSYPPVLFARKLGDKRILYKDLTVKGGGTDIHPNVTLFVSKSTEPGTVSYDPNHPIPNVVEENGKTFTVRYDTRPLVQLTSPLGSHDLQRGLSDRFMSRYLENRGLRTRTMVAAWKIPDDSLMSTPEGLVTAKQFGTLTNTDPNIEIWASRCKYRIKDVLRYVYEMENLDPKPNIMGMKLHPARVDYRNVNKDNQSHYYDPTNYPPEVRQQLRETFVTLANEIRVRAEFDEDPRFSNLARQFAGGVNDDNISDFYKEYLKHYSSILGEQFAVLHNAHAISGMFNLQNISLLGEIFDHDVTMIDGKVMDEKGKLIEPSPERLERFKLDRSDPTIDFFNQLSVGYEGIAEMEQMLSHTGIIMTNENEIYANLDRYLQSFKSAISTSDQINFLQRAKINIPKPTHTIANRLFDPFNQDLSTTFCTNVSKVFAANDM